MESRGCFQRPAVRCHSRKRRRSRKTPITIPRQRTDSPAGDGVLRKLVAFLALASTTVPVITLVPVWASPKLEDRRTRTTTPEISITSSQVLDLSDRVYQL